MTKKYLIANMHSDRDINKWTEYFVASLHKNNPKLVCLLEGVRLGTEFSTINPDTIDLYQKLLNSWLDNKLTNTQQEDLLKLLGKEQMLSMPVTKLILKIMSSMPCKGIDNDMDCETATVNTFKEFLQLASTEITGKAAERDAFLYQNIKNHPGECVVIIGFAHIINWLQKGLLNEDYIIICPSVDVSCIKNAVDNYNKVLKTNIQYDEQLAQETLSKFTHIKGVQYIDIKDWLSNNNQNNLYLNLSPEDNISDLIGEVGNNHE